MQTRIGTGSISDVAAFTRSGADRRTGMTLAGGAIVQSYATSAGLEGLDMFGRVGTLAYTTLDGSTTRTLFGAVYAYDAAGNRTTAEVTRAATATTSESNQWSQWNQYNALGQLTRTDFGPLSSGSVPSPKIRDEWNLDALGNWNANDPGNSTPSGRVTTDYRPTTPTVRTIGDKTDGRNRVSSRNDTAGPTLAYTYDTAGNLRSDGSYFYQYDAWNRLIQVNTASANSTFTAEPTLDTNPTYTQERWIPGAMLKHFKYDGLGRLIEVQSPFPDAVNMWGELRTERFYYDGIRRIQEVVIDPMLSLGAAAVSGDPELEAAATGGSAPDEQTATLELEEVQLSETAPIPVPMRLEREYIWGPGEKGVDELLVQFDTTRAPWWMLTDAGGDIVAMCRKVGSGSTAYARVYMLDLYPLHKEQIQERNTKIGNAVAAYKSANKDEELAKLDIAGEVLKGLDDWLASVAICLDRTEQEELANVSWIAT